MNHKAFMCEFSFEDEMLAWQMDGLSLTNISWPLGLIHQMDVSHLLWKLITPIISRRITTFYSDKFAFTHFTL